MAFEREKKEHAAEVAAQEAASAAETDQALQASASEFQEDSKDDIFRWLKRQVRVVVCAEMP